MNRKNFIQLLGLLVVASFVPLMPLSHVDPPQLGQHLTDDEIKKISDKWQKALMSTCPNPYVIWENVIK